jgi:TfoX/Sxy family transcriptional regulator of competence genes
LIKITKSERDYLEGKGFGFPYYLHRTFGKHKKYYATEDKKLMMELNYFRNKSVVSTVN